MNKKIIFSIIVFLILLVIFFLAQREFLSLQFIQSHFLEVKDYQAQHPFLTFLIYFSVYISIAALAVPGAGVLTLMGGALYGLAAGTVAVSFAASIGSTMAFLAARYLFRDAINAKYEKQIGKIQKKIAADGDFYLFFLRLNPVIPFFLINSIMGLTPMGTWRFFYISQIGMLPGTLLYVNAGTQLSQIKQMQDLISPTVLISFFLLGIFPLVVKKLLKMRSVE